MVDIEKEKDRLKKEEQRLLAEISRVDKKLSNEGFLAKAPQKVIEEEKAKRADYMKQLENVRKVYADL